MTKSREWRKETLEQVDKLAEDVEEMTRQLNEEYRTFVDTVRTNGLDRRPGQAWQTTFEVPSEPFWLTWRPDTTDTVDIGLYDGDDLYFLPRAYLEDPEAWLQGALAAHGQFVATQAVSAAQRRAERKVELRRQLEALEAEG